MTDENRVKIREALTWMANEALDALALLDAEDTPSVPMAMLWEVSSLVESATMQDRLAYCRSIANRFGYTISEDDAFDCETPKNVPELE